MWTVSRPVQAPSGTVWKLLVDVDAWPKWGPSVVRAELDRGVLTLGTRGRVWTPVGVALPFEITARSDRRSGTLRALALHREPRVRWGARHDAGLERALGRLAATAGLESVEGADLRTAGAS